MTVTARTAGYFIGWDVGGWNCDSNGKSRDALVLLDATRRMVGTPWRGNLRATINAAATTGAWVTALFAHCGAALPTAPCHVTLAIDTPLGFSQEFVRLVTDLHDAGPLGSSDTNRYLYRHTERWLFARGLHPLSAVKDMLGSQATKGMHVLARFAPHRESCGIWTDGRLLTAIEAYPSACRTSALIQDMRRPYPTLTHQDITDALTCALLACLFAEERSTLAPPDADTPASEGWIWVPRCRRLPSASPLCSPVLAIRHDSGVSLRYTEGHLV